MNIFLVYKKFKIIFFAIIVLFLLSGVKSLFSIALLTIWGIIANLVAVYILNIVGIPGALIAGQPQKLGTLYRFLNNELRNL